jgi:hypothetical protein
VSFALKFTTGTGTPAAALVPGGYAQLLGIAASNAEAAVYYLKLWWAANSGSTSVPTVGTTIPSLTLPIPTTGQPLTALTQAVNNGGPLWYWVTKNAADTDATALTTGGDVVNLILE